ncbi:MAG: hypothetical protein O2782_10020, partial [bacterium]|nr:hypothetical protein [bacterium]
MSTARILEYQLSCIGGLEDVAIDELHASLGTRVKALRAERGEVGRLYFHTEASPRRLLELGCPTSVEAVAAQAHDVTVGQPGLQRVLRCLRGLPLDAVRRLAEACDRDIELTSVDLRVTMHGAHRFSTRDVEAGCLPILQEAGLQICHGPTTSHPLRLIIRIRGKRVLITLQLGPRRPSGDPQKEGWVGPAANSVRRLLDLDDNLPVAGAPLPGSAKGLTIERSGMRVPVKISAKADCLPISTGALPVLLLMPRLDDDDVGRQLLEAVRAVTPGGVLGLLVR